MNIYRTLLTTSICAAVFGCGGEALDPMVDTVASSLETTGLPTGTTCGLAYGRPGSPVYGNNFCSGSERTVWPSPENGHCVGENLGPVNAEGFQRVADGDRGLPTCNGFFHWRFTPGNSVRSDLYRLPKGTACGFKEACNNRGELCMGFDANVSCPAGWARRVASDMKAPSGCGFVWCEYQDPNNLCTTRSCNYDNQPYGLVCGITDNDRNNGQCQGTATTLGCPFGYVRYGFFDDGRSAGHGVGWCAKDVVVP